MKVTFPKNIKKGFLSGFNLNIGPISLSVIQLLMVALGVGLALVAFNAGQRAGSRGAGTVLAIIVLVFVLFVTFFKVSEMNILQFIAKKIRENFFDVTKKYQTNSEKIDAIDVALKEGKIQETRKQVVEQKKEPEVEEIFENIKNDELI